MIVVKNKGNKLYVHPYTRNNLKAKDPAQEDTILNQHTDRM